MEDCCLLGAQINRPRDILWRTNNFTITPALGQMGIEGYLLVCSDKHFTGVCGVPAELDNELEGVFSIVKGVVSTVYSSPVVAFEHGPRIQCYKGGGCLEHAHIHVVPTRADVIGFLREKDFNLKEIEGFSKLRDIYDSAKSSYLMVEQGDRRHVSEVDVLPSQYLRRAIASLEGKENWDWREHPDRETFYRTLNTLKGKF